jgi:MYXO-CTERM domain-containing protein
VIHVVGERTSRRRSAACACAALLLAAALIPSAAAGYQRAEVTGVSGRYLYWPQRTVDYTVNKLGCKDVSLQATLGAVKRAFFTWASPSCTDVYFIYKGLSAETKTNLVLGQNEKPDLANLVVWHNSWPPKGVSSAAVTKEMPAVTTVVYSTETGVIVDADIDLNGHDFFWTTIDDSTKAATDIQNILTHEIGHVLGLTHSSNQGATMWEGTNQAELEKRTLHADDQLGVCTIYPFDDVTPKGSGQGTVPQEVQGGCAAAPGQGGAAAGLALLGLLLLGARRRRR